MSTTRKAPLTARSVLASVLLGTDPPWLPTARLVRTAELFGISEGTARTALSRMATAGEAEADDGGYRLVGRLAARRDRQAASRAAATLPWDGTWELVVVDGDGRRPAAARAALRDALRQLRFAELREGVWTRPTNLPADRTPAAAEVVDAWCQRWRGAEPSGDVDLAALFDLAGWQVGAELLQAEVDALLPRLEAGDVDALAAGFVTSAAVLRHLQHDPLLPDVLLPPAWPGEAFRAAYDRYDAAYRAVLRTWLRD